MDTDICNACGGDGEVTHADEFGDINTTLCYACQGKGYVLTDEF